MSLASSIASGLTAINSVVKYGENVYSSVKPIINSAQTIQNLLSPKKKTVLPSIVSPTQPPQYQGSNPPATDSGVNLGSVQPNLSSYKNYDPMMMGLYGLAAVLVLVLIVKK